MRVLLIVLAAASLPAFAENQLTDRDRAVIARLQAQREAALVQAKQRCIEQRGVDCVSEQGLQEWLLLDRSREQAVLDNVRPIELPSAGVGSTSPSAPPR